jgi:hypothetical protein
MNVVSAPYDTLTTKKYAPVKSTFVFLSLDSVPRLSKIFPDQTRHLHHVVVPSTIIFRLVTDCNKARIIRLLTCPASFPSPLSSR